MSEIKSLAKDTAIYGLSSIVGRFLNYLLFPLYTHVIPAASGGNGIITHVYAYTALLLVILTFGMETTLFRFINREDETNPTRVYTTTLAAVGTAGILFLAVVFLNLGSISTWMGYAKTPEYIAMMAIVIALDAFQAIPYAYLRHQKRPIKFATLKLGFILLNITLNLLAFWVLPTLVEGYEIKVGYAFAINLICTSVITLGFWKELFGLRWNLDFNLLRRMLRYAWPILVFGIAGILNQTADKMILPALLPGLEGQVQLGIYSSAFKLAMIMALITTAFRYAYEPFVFASTKGGDTADKRKTYALTMKYFLIFTLFAFLAVVAYLDVLKYMMGSDYWEGLRVVPIIMVAEILMGIYFNLSFWYKLTDRTIWGAWFSGAGCAVLLVVNFLFIPQYGYIACAWAGVAGYGTATLLSYFVGQHYYPIPYPLKDIAKYVGLTAILFAAMTIFPDFIEQTWLRLTLNSLLIGAYLAYVVRTDLPLSSLPLVGKHFRKPNT